MLINEDCMKVLRGGGVADKSIDLTLTDIPYNVVNRDSNGLRNFNKKDADILTFNLKDFIAEICRVTKGSIYIFCSTEQVSEIRHLLISYGLSTRLCIWEKTNPSPVNGQNIWLSGIECCVFGKFKGATFNEHCKNTVFRFPTVRGKIHPTQKPLELIKYLVTVSSNENDVVFDPCMGSGVVGVACKLLNRKFIGIEINKEYFNKAIERINKIESNHLPKNIR